MKHVSLQKHLNICNFKQKAQLKYAAEIFSAAISTVKFYRAKL